VGLAVLIVTPHSSGHVPQDVLAAMLGDSRDDVVARDELLHKIFLQGDPFTDVIFDVPGAHVLHAWMSRFVVDVNRRREHQGSNGVVKVTDFDSVPLYPPGSEPTGEEIEERLRRYWDPFHNTIGRLLETNAIELLLDGHSMTATGPALGPDHGAVRPAITLMTGGDAEGEPRASVRPSLDPELARKFQSLAERFLAPVLEAASAQVEPEVALNRPWSADELSYHHGPPRGVPAFGLEVNRDLYLDESTGQPLPERLRLLRQGLVAFTDAALAATRQLTAKGVS